MLRNWLFLLLSFTLGTACSAPESKSESNPVVSGYNLIDSGRADEAVEHFEVLLASDPENDEYRRGLSSAHAFRGGFRIQVLVQPLKDIQSSDSLKQDFEPILKNLLAIHPQLKGLENFLRMEIEVLVFLRKFSAIPNLSSLQVRDLRLGLLHLQDLQKPTQGDYLYMAVLEALILKQTILKPMQALNCDQTVRQVQKRLQVIASQYGKILYYMNLAQPSKTESYDKQYAQVEKFLGETTLLTSTSIMTLSLIEHASNSIDNRLFKVPKDCTL